jgi:hypothetical protein
VSTQPKTTAEQPRKTGPKEISEAEFFNLAGIASIDAHAPTEILEEPPTRSAGTKAEARRDRCMKCDRPPTRDVKWAEGMGRAWFCQGHYSAWAKEHDGDIDGMHVVEGGEVPEQWGG